MERGTSFTRSARFCAVTMISPRALLALPDSADGVAVMPAGVVGLVCAQTRVAPLIATPSRTLGAACLVCTLSSPSPCEFQLCCLAAGEVLHTWLQLAGIPRFLGTR